MTYLASERLAKASELAARISANLRRIVEESRRD